MKVRGASLDHQLLAYPSTSTSTLYAIVFRGGISLRSGFLGDPLWTKVEDVYRRRLTIDVVPTLKNKISMICVDAALEKLTQKKK